MIEEVTFSFGSQLRVHDKTIQLQNNYEKEVFNREQMARRFSGSLDPLAGGRMKLRLNRFELGAVRGSEESDTAHGLAYSKVNIS